MFPLTLTEDGTIRVTGSQVALESVVYQYQQGNTAEAILESFPSVKLPDIHAVISCYLNHRDQVDEYPHDQQKRRTRLAKASSPIPHIKPDSVNCIPGSSLAWVHSIEL
ncbi:MAG: hypothetical protein DMG65_03225 [Candidatus Angelobacter sp. Gp1-AA117]|nr:MAG: hypothetical protein DMG65_03225 [Candidatus Angelobacter sp. Gp1-AA117]